MRSVTSLCRASASRIAVCFWATIVGCGGAVEDTAPAPADATADTEFVLDTGALDAEDAIDTGFDEGSDDGIFDGGGTCGAEIRRDTVWQVCCEGSVCRGDCFRVSATAGTCRCFDVAGGCPDGLVCCYTAGGCTSEAKCSK